MDWVKVTLKTGGFVCLVFAAVVLAVGVRQLTVGGGLDFLVAVAVALVGLAVGAGFFGAARATARP